MFIVIGILFIIDLTTKKTVFQVPKNGNKRIVTIVLLLLVLLYPIAGLIAGRHMDRLIYPGTLPCPTTALALVLLVLTAQKPNKTIYFLLLIWAIPFPPLIQIPKYHVYEDSIMFLIGIYALAVLLLRLYKTNRRLSLKKYKQIFSFNHDSVFVTSSADCVPNIVPVHSKHLVPGNKVLISDQFMNKTKSNIVGNPFGTLIIKDSGRLYRISGVCQYKTSGFMYRMAVKGAEKYARENARHKNITIKCKGIVLMDVLDVNVEAIIKKGAQ